MKGFGGFAKAFEAAIDKTLGIDGAQAEAVIGCVFLLSVCKRGLQIHPMSDPHLPKNHSLWLQHFVYSYFPSRRVCLLCTPPIFPRDCPCQSSALSAADFGRGCCAIAAQIWVYV
jgi:hypothetical protein